MIKDKRVMDVGAIMLLGLWVRFGRQRRFRKVKAVRVPDAGGGSFEALPFEVTYEDGRTEMRKIGDRVTAYKRRPRGA